LIDLQTAVRRALALLLSSNSITTSPDMAQNRVTLATDVPEMGERSAKVCLTPLSFILQPEFHSSACS
jgi:hypothetical protein